jgi:hypothetical protein
VSAWTDIRDSVRKIILMQDKIDRLATGLSRLSAEVMDHEKRLIRIETMIQMAQTRRGDGSHRIE